MLGSGRMSVSEGGNGCEYGCLGVGVYVRV